MLLDGVRVDVSGINSSIITLGSPVVGFRSVAEASGVNAAVYEWVIEANFVDGVAQDREGGVGAWSSSGNTLGRTTLWSTEAANAQITLTGTSHIIITPLAGALHRSGFATPRGDSNYTILQSDGFVYTSASLTAPRTWTLPPAALYAPGRRLTISDLDGGVGPTNTLTIDGNASEAIDALSTLVLSVPYASVDLESSGINWKVVGLTRPLAPAGITGGVGDTNYTIPPTQNYIFTNGFLTANRIWTLPLASSVPAGWELTIGDAAGTVNSVYATAFYTLTIQRAGSDNIHDQTSVVLTSMYQLIKLISNGSSGWTIVSGLPLTYTTGDLKPTHKLVADPTWIMWADGTIGDGSSGANVFANIAAFRLFELYYDWYGATECPLLTSAGGAATRGAVGTATTAWAGHYRMTLPRGAGRKMTISGTGSGLSARTLGSSFFGAESDTPTIAKMVSHDHDDHIAQPGGTPAVYWNTVGPGGPSDTLSGSRGSSNPVPILDPETIINVMIKL